eukprot:g3119.t1
MSSVPEDWLMLELRKAKRALEEGYYSPEDYAVISGACAIAQSLQIGINAGVVFSQYEMQAAFFTALGLPGRPSNMRLAEGVPVRSRPAVIPTQPIPATEVDRNRVPPRPGRLRRHPVGSRPMDGLERDHRP